MFVLIASAKPRRFNEIYRKASDAYIEIYIDYKDFEGAVILAEHYLEEAQWKVLEFRDEYFEVNSEADIPETHLPFYQEARKFGYCLAITAFAKEPK